jgi:hypothetical protein
MRSGQANNTRLVIAEDERRTAEEGVDRSNNTSTVDCRLYGTVLCCERIQRPTQYGGVGPLSLELFTTASARALYFRTQDRERIRWTRSIRTPTKS